MMMPGLPSVVTIAIIFASVPLAPVATGTGGEVLRPPTVRAFERYVELAESRMDTKMRGRNTFLYVDGLAEAERGRTNAVLRRGEVFIGRLETRDQGKAVTIPDGLVHHWVGVALIAGVRVNDAVRLVQDYDRHADIYAPAVQRSKVLARDGDKVRVFLRFYQKRVVAVTVNSEHEAEFFRAGENRVYSRIRSVRIAEVADAGEAGEREKPVGDDGGYLWRLNTYWRFLERDAGT